MTRLFTAFAALFFLTLAPVAHAAGLTVSTSTLQAGAPADVTVNATFDTAPTSVALHLPPGLVGNPKSAAQCLASDFEGLGGCSASSQVGTATANGIPGAIYNLKPNAGEPARLGISILGVIKNEAAVSLRPDGGLDSTIATLNSPPLVSVTSLGLTLSHTFMTLPTSCQVAPVTLNGLSDSFTPTGCASVPFNPSVAATLDTTQRAVPSGAIVTLTVPANNSNVRKTEILLPVGTSLSPGVADGLAACSDAQFESSDGCPAGAQVGTVSFETPVLDPLAGKVFFGDGFRLYIQIAGQGVQVKLAGDVKLDPSTGQITTVFDNLPQVPFTKFALQFNGGPHAVLANPPTCGTKDLSATLTPWSGTAPKVATATLTIDQGCALAFAPSLTVSAGSTAAGRPAGAVTMTVGRSDSDQNLARVTTNLPPGLAGSLKGVPVCPDANADAGTCPANSQVGTVSALAGTGDAPVPLSGTVSLTGPTDGGLAGLAIALPGKVGPVDLGTVAIRAAIILRPDGGLTVKTRPIPQILGGIPIAIKQLALTLNRPGFILNASSCALQQVTADLEGASGATTNVAAPYQATDCGGLPFTPKLEATIGKRGATGKGVYPPLSTVVTVPNGNSSTALAAVTLPSQLGADLKRLGAACPAPNYAAGTCPKTSVIGSTSASTPLLPNALSGPVNLAVSSGGTLGLGLTLAGGGVSLPLFGAITPATKLVTSFNGIPDVPLERFALNFTGGKTSPLKLNHDACSGSRMKASAAFTGHNGVKKTVSTTFKVIGCPPIVSVKRHGHRYTIRVTPGRDGAKIKKTTLTKPRKLSFTRTKTLTFTKKPKLKLTVKDAAGQNWRITR